jgi:hypothetical protein
VDSEEFRSRWNISSAVDTLDAARSISRLLKLDEARTRHALCIAATQTAGLARNAGGAFDEESKIALSRSPVSRCSHRLSFRPIRQHFVLKRHLLRASRYRKQLGERSAAWYCFSDPTQGPFAF